MLRVEENMLISTFVETPAGIAFFYALTDTGWKRKYLSISKDPNSFLKGIGYGILAKREIGNKKIPIEHWTFNYN